MRIFKLSLIAVAALIAWSATAEAIDVKKRREAPGTPAQVWAVVGDFCAIKNWHPAVAECEQTKEDDVVFRILTLKDGAKIKEKLTKTGDTSYSYEIIEGPLPVKNYTAELMVGEDDEPERVEIVWTATFDAEGASDEEAKKTIAGIFDAGVTGIKKAAIAADDAKRAAAGDAPAHTPEDKDDD